MGKGPTEGINGSVWCSRKLVFTILKQIQNFAVVYITMVMRVACM